MSPAFGVKVVAADPALREEVTLAAAPLPRADGRAPTLLVVVDDAAREPAFVLHAARQEAHGPLTGALVLLPAPDGARVAALLKAGASDAAAWPVAPAELVARLERIAAADRVVAERAAALEQAERADAELRRLRESRVMELVQLFELAVPGARARAERVVQLAGRLAQDCTVPAEFRGDLASAAWLSEIGRLVHRASDAPLEDVLVGSGTVVSAIAGLEPVAELVNAVAENWDGTGRPARKRMGQIPFRSRLLRVAIDYLAATDAGENGRVALERMSAHAGTWYDPQVIGHLAHTLGGSRSDRFASTSRVVPVGDLAEGMVLAEDLYAESGVKLLSGGTALSRLALEAIQERHLVDPILGGAVVRR